MVEAMTRRIVLLLAGFACGACPPGAAGLHQPSAEPTSQPTTRDFSEVALAQAKAIEAAVQARDSKVIRQIFDSPALAGRAMARVEALPMAEAQVQAQLRDFYADMFAREVFPWSEAGGYQFLRAVRRPDDPQRPRLLFRLVTPQGINYHEHLLHPGTGRVIDTYVLLTGDTLASVMGSTLERNASALMPGGSLPRELRLLEEMQASLAEEDPASAIKAYNSAPQRVRENTVVLLTRLRAATALPESRERDAAIAEATDDLRRVLGEDSPAAALMSVDAYLAAGRSDDAMAAVDLINRWTGGDPYLDVLRANILLGQGEVEIARVVAEAAVRATDLPGAHATLLDIALAQRDHDTTLRQLRTLRDRFGWTFTDIRSAAGFEEFVKSPQFGTWQQDGAAW